MIFPACSQQASDQTLINLGGSMMIQVDSSTQTSEMPAGYLFLSQFITNDITDLSAGNRSQPGQNRRRTLDLDCIYGDPEINARLREERYSERMIVGQTMGAGEYAADFCLPNDLPRVVDGEQAGRALIGDPRNDENLGLAQTHLLFLKLHNRFAVEGMNYETARTATIQHYQSMVINDFLRKILDPNVFSAVFEQPRYVSFSPTVDGLPLEFLLAVNHYSLSMISDSYEWNRFHSTGGETGPLDLSQLYRLTERRGDLGGHSRLPTQWVVDWRKFYHLDRQGDGSSPNMARKIDARLIRKLDHLIDIQTPSGDESEALAVKLLRQAKQYEIPSGQAVVEMLNERGLGLRKLDGEALQLEQKELLQNTPLWYYVLRESYLQQSGDRLGEVGSWLLADTFKRLILDSPNSVLNDIEFSPRPDVLNGKRTLNMASLIEYVDDINPLEAL
jgi:hypothetical protein